MRVISQLQMKFKNGIDGEIFKDLTQAKSEDKIGSTKTSKGSTENNMPNSFVTAKEVALMRKALDFKASGKEEDNERKEEELEQCCHEVMEAIVSTNGESGTATLECALVGSYVEGGDGNLGHSQDAETKTEEKWEAERREGKEMKEENEWKYPDHSESQGCPLQVAGPSEIDKEPHHTCDVSGFDSRLTPIRKEQQEIIINSPQDDVHPEDVEKSDNFHLNDLLCFAWQIANGMVSRVSHKTRLIKFFVAVSEIISKIFFFSLVSHIKLKVFNSQCEVSLLSLTRNC